MAAEETFQGIRCLGDGSLNVDPTHTIFESASPRSVVCRDFLCAEAVGFTRQECRNIGEISELGVQFFACISRSVGREYRSISMTILFERKHIFASTLKGKEQNVPNVRPFFLDTFSQVLKNISVKIRQLERVTRRLVSRPKSMLVMS